MSLGPGAAWTCSWGRCPTWRVLTHRLKALTAAHAVSVEARLVPLGVLVSCEARSVDSSPVLRLDDKSRSVSAWQVWDHASL